MHVECVFFGPFRDEVGEKTVTRETDAATVGDLLAEVEAAYPGLEGRLLDGEEVVSEVAVTLNDTHVQHIDGADTELSDGDVLRMTPAVYGG
jgi:molybdopterin synthase sulfur carrier subunit